MDLCFDVCKQVVTRTDNEQVVNLSDNYLRLCFTFKGTDWANLTKFVLVHHKRGTTRLELTGDKVTLPDGLLLSDKLVFTVYGVDDPDDESVRVTTNKQKVYLLDSSYTDEYSEIAEVISVHTIEDIYDSLDGKANVTALEGKVDKITGKGLSSNDYTDFDKVIVSNIEEELEKVIEELEPTLMEEINKKVNISDVKDNLTSSDVDKPLSAKQGKVLKDTVDLKVNTSDIQDDFTSTATDKPLAAVCGKQLYEIKAEREHFHSKEDITDFSHNHDDRYYTESEVDTKLNDKSNVGHLHDDRYYTETEVDQIITGLLNRCSLNSDKDIIQTGGTANLTAYVLKNGAPLPNSEVKFYKIVED